MPRWASFLSLLFLVSLLRLAGAICADFDRYDLGFVLTEAVRLSAGELPYRDYFCTYGPLEPALLVPWVRWLGAEALLVLALRSAAWGLVATAVAWLAYRLRGREAAVWALTLWFAAAGEGLMPHPALAALMLMPCLLVQAWTSGRRARWLLGAGVLAGIAALFRWDFGGLALLAGAAAVVWEARRREGGAPAAEAATFVGGALPAWIAYGGVVFAAGVDPVAQVLRQLRAAAPYRSLPWAAGSADQVGRLLLLVAGAVLLARGLRRARERGGPGAPLLLCLSLQFVGLLVYANFRPDAAHLNAPAAVAALGAGVGLGSLRAARLRELSLMALALWLVGAVVAAEHRRAERVPVTLRGLWGLRMKPEAADEYERLRLELDARAPADAPIFVGALYHSRHVINDAFLYAYLGRPIPTRYHAFNPGVTTTEAVQQQLRVDLRGVDVIILGRGTWWEEPNRSQEQGSSLLDDLLEVRYEIALTFERWYVLAPRGSTRSSRGEDGR